MSAKDPLCQGLTFWHPPQRTSREPNANNNSAILSFISELFEQRFDFLFVLLLGFSATKTSVGETHFAVPID